MSISLELEEITTTERLEALWVDWSSLWDRCPSATPFQSPAWLLPWWRNLFGGGKLWSFALWDEGRLVGLAPLFLYGYGARPEVRRLTFIGAGITDYSDCLFEPEFASAGMVRILGYLLERESEWDLGDFQELRASSPLLNTAMPTGMGCKVLPCSVCPVLVLPQSVEQLWAGLERPFRTDLHRSMNRVVKSGAVFETAGTSNLDEFLSALFRLHSERWQQRHESGVLDNAQLQMFHREVASRMLERGRLRLYGLRSQGNLIAIQYNLVSYGRSYAYLSGFDTAAARISPGKALVQHAIEDAIAEGLTEFDFLRKQESFKYEWGSEDRPNRRVLLSNTAGQTSGAGNLV